MSEAPPETSEAAPAPAEAFAGLRARARSVQLATVDASGAPLASYAPFAFDADGALLIFVSELARHTRDLQAVPRCGAMLIDDEAASHEIFARLRASYECRVETVARDDPAFEAELARLRERQGKMIELLRTLRDFTLFRLVPESGLFVMGFGRAYRLGGPALDRFEHVRAA